MRKRKIKTALRPTKKGILSKGSASPLLDPKKLFDLTAPFPPGWWRIYEAFNLADPLARLALARQAVGEYEKHKMEVRDNLNPPGALHRWRWVNEETGESNPYNPSVWVELFKT